MAPDTTSDTGPDTRPNLTAAYKALAVAAATVGLAAFAVSFHGLYDLLKRLAELPWYLSVVGPLGVDCFALVGVAAHFVLRHENWRRRAYAVFVMAFALGLSFAGNWVDAVSRHVVTAAVIGLALSPVVVFLSGHLVVVCRRAMEDRRRMTVLPSTLAPSPADVDGTDDPEDEEPAMSGPRPFNPRGYARIRRRAGDSCKTIADRLAERGHKVHERTVARWVQDIKPDAATDTEPAPEGARS